ncbi:hypothetical protein [Streptomyces avicenniae]|uniref:hypothetical protein n=1 Tax=Streptomyces avicenniae TaxID=500153 RepID=UPI00069B04C9|nr:hypothetical protein [Streptomyces avicenniae]
MTRAQAPAASATHRSAGIVADGVFKTVLGAACLVGAVPLGELLGVPGWMTALSGVVLLIAGGIGIAYMRSRSIGTYLRLMIAYDSGWALAALVGLVVAWRGGEAGGEVWVGYQTVAPLVFAALLITADPALPRTRSEYSAR